MSIINNLFFFSSLPKIKYSHNGVNIAVIKTDCNKSGVHLDKWTIVTKETVNNVGIITEISRLNQFTLIHQINSFHNFVKNHHNKNVYKNW